MNAVAAWRRDSENKTHEEDVKLNPSPLLADKKRGRGVAVCGWCLWGHKLAFILVVSVMQKAAVELCRACAGLSADRCPWLPLAIGSIS